MNYSGRHILVLGAARSGRAAAELLLRAGARVAVYDRKAEALAGLPAGVETLSGDSAPGYGGFDAVVASPGFPTRADPKLIPEVDLAAQFLDARLIGVTGSNGKSTTTTLVGEILAESGFRTGVGGNIGTALCSLVGQGYEWVVAELSSFQLEHARALHADVALLLNLAPDHFDRHGTLERYGAAKARLAELQAPEAWLVANRDDAWSSAVARKAPARVAWFSTRERVETGAWLDGDSLCVVREGELRARIPLAELSSASRRPVDNALASAAAADLAGASADAIHSVLARFQGLPHRVRDVCVRAGVRWVDDSKATNPAAAVASLLSQTTRIVWLAGGRNKGLDFAPLADAARRARVRIAYVFGESAEDLARVLSPVIRVERVDTLADAVAYAAASARPGDVVLLAPACASFDQFKSFEDRGEQFAALACAIPEGAGGAAC
ncbi:MAG TPA: UDP-N-acetylmuramoyl-L-alanine--D-glutamate ligase [Myxococcota bacterium]|nr:UDP-N-acetylmuramoyl-L-alanine--D-glutamate ligase [Myxococcota bacterium]